MSYINRVLHWRSSKRLRVAAPGLGAPSQPMSKSKPHHQRPIPMGTGTGTGTETGTVSAPHSFGLGVDQSQTAPGVIWQLLSSLPERIRETERLSEGDRPGLMIARAASFSYISAGQVPRWYEYLAKTRLIS